MGGLAKKIPTGPNIPQAVDASGNYILTGHNGFNGEGCEIRLFDQRTSKNVVTLEGHTEAVNSVSFLRSSGDIFVSCSKDQTVKLWSVPKAKQLYSTEEKYGTVFCVSAAGGYVFAGNIKSYLMVYSVDEIRDRLELKAIL